MGKWQNRLHKPEVSSFPAGDHKAHINRRSQRHSKQKTEKNIKKIHKRSTTLERSIKYFLEGLSWFFGVNLSLNSDVDLDTKIFGLHERLLIYQCIIS